MAHSSDKSQVKAEAIPTQPAVRDGKRLKMARKAGMSQQWLSCVPPNGGLWERIRFQTPTQPKSGQF